MINELDGFRLIFKEQWWLVSAFTDLDGDKLTDEIKRMNNFAETQIKAFTEAKIDPKFIPDANDRQKIASLSQNLKIELKWENYIEKFNFKTKNYTYDKLGFLLFRVRLKDNTDFNIIDIRPNYLQQIIYQVWIGLIENFKFEFKFDDSTPPYIISVCCGNSTGTLIKWGKEITKKYNLIILAGGEDTAWCRPYGYKRKVFLPLLGKPMLSWVIEAFRKSEYIDNIIVIGPKEMNQFDSMRHVRKHLSEGRSLIDNLLRAALYIKTNIPGIDE